MINLKKEKAPATITQYTIKKVKDAEDFPQTKITSSQDAYNVIRQFWHEDIEVYESMFILLLNRANKTIGWAKISQGGIAGTMCDPKLVMKYAVDSLASGVILAHNHPSGNLNPSQADKDVTNKVKNALSLIDSVLFDHLILTPDSYISMQEEGQL